MSDDFERDVLAFAAQLETNEAATFGGIVAAVHDSIAIGSAVTASPGQPVQTGALRNSYATDFLEDRRAQISTSLAYAQPIEEGIGPHGPLTLRSEVGGFHSIKLTSAAFPQLVNDVVREVTGG